LRDSFQRRCFVQNEKRSEDFITEDSLLDWLKVKKATLTGLRLNRRFPFIRVTNEVRLYHVPDVLNWLLENRKVSNQGEPPRL
jgi:hypothetical protein